MFADGPLLAISSVICLSSQWSVQQWGWRNESCFAACSHGFAGIAEELGRRLRLVIRLVIRQFQRRICRGQVRRATVARKAEAESISMKKI
jgi:hypothetical protein